MSGIQGTRWVHILADQDGTPIVVSETGPGLLRKIAGPNHVVFEAVLIYLRRAAPDTQGSEQEGH